ncbi:MAG: sodium:solute symporter family protein [Bacteroidota bacterium]
MISWFWILSVVFVLMLVLVSTRAVKTSKNVNDFMLAGSSVGGLLGTLTYAAALFSAFVFIGVPDFFRVHGVGAWIFLPVSDGIMFFMIFWFGYHLRKKVKEIGYRGTAGMMSKIFGNKWAGYVVFIAAFLFLIPYVSIQIRGISMFFIAIFPNAFPLWGWALLIISIMLIYSEIGGLKAIVFSDAIQAILLLTVLVIIGYNSVQHFGNIKEMFVQVKQTDPALLSTPGPKGLFTPQFLITSFLAIILLPVTQPQFSSRIAIMKNMKETYKMATGVGIIAFFVFAATALIGMYGSVVYSGSTTQEFVENALLFDQPNIIAALAIVGLFAAVLSTSNAQVFALGSEFRSLLTGPEKVNFRNTKIALFVFGMIVLFTSVVIGDELVLLARMSFAGTAMIAPIVLVGVFSKKKPGVEIIISSFIALVLFTLSLANVLPTEMFGVRLDVVLMAALFVISVVSVVSRGTFKAEKSE